MWDPPREFASVRSPAELGLGYIFSAYSSGSAPHQREESEVANMRRLCHFRIRLRGWDCTRGYDLFFLCTCVGLDLIRVHSQLEKKNSGCILVKRTPDHRLHKQYLKCLKLVFS